MKKRFLLLLCILALLIGCAVVASAASTRTAYCEHCKQTVTWEPVQFGSLLTGEHKHYYLTADKTSTTGSDQIAVRGGSKLCLDLNGKTWKSYGRAMISGTNDDGAGYISLMDSVGGGAIEGMSKKTSAPTGTNNNGGGTFWVSDTCTMNIYSGTYRLNAIENEYGLRTDNGGVAYVTGGTLNLYGGTIEGSTVGKNGAAIYLTSSGKFNAYGGTVTKGESRNGTGSCVGFNGSTGTVTLSGNASVADIYFPSLNPAQLVIDGSFTGSATLTYKSTVSLSVGTVVGSLQNSGSITGADLYCTNGFDLTADGTQLKLTASQGKRYECPACKQVVKWSVFSPSSAPTAEGSYHYYLDKDYDTSTAKQWTVKGGAVACLDLNGHSYTTVGRSLGVSSDTYSTLNLIDTVGTGIVTAQGGNNNPGGGTVSVGTTSTFNLYGGSLAFEHTPENSTKYGGTARGGVIQLAGTMNVYGGKIIGGEVVDTTYEFTGIEGAGGAIYLSGKLNLYGGELLSGIAAPSGAGPCVYVANSTAVVTLSGDAKVEDICFSSHKPAQLVVSGTYTGSANISYAPAIALSERLVIGTMASDAVSQAQITCGTFFVQPFAQSLLLSRYGAEDTAATGGIGYNSLQEAIDACTDGYVELLKDVPENISVSRDLRLQLNSCSVSGTVTVAEGATLSVLDSATDDYTVSDGKYGKLKAVVGAVTGAEGEDGGYLMVTEAAGVSFHKVTLQIYAMTLRTDSEGQPALFYKSHFKADEKAAPLVDTYGVALSIIDTPTERNLETKCAYTVFEGFESGVNGNLGNASSTLLTGILKLQNTEKDNLRNLSLPVYGRAYAKAADGQLLFGNAVCRSLSQQLQDIDGMVSSLSAVQMQLVTKLYTTFREVLKQEALPAISQAVQTEEEGILKVLILGNSHSLDATNLLYEVFRAEAPEQKVVLGALYYSGCSIKQHSQFLPSNQKVYTYYKNDGSQPNRTWVLKDSTCLEALQDEQWDIIFMQSGCRNGGKAEVYDGTWKIVADYLMNNQDIAPKLGLHFSWTNPDDYELYLNDDAPYNHPSTPTSYRQNLEKLYGVDGKYNQDLQYQLATKYLKQYIFDRSDVMGREFDLLASGCTAIQYAHDVCGRPLPEIYRDYTHLNDFSRVIASYTMYAAIMGIDEISEVKMDTIPVALKHKNSQYPVADANGEYKLDAQMQTDIIASVNWALKNPFSLPESN